MRIGYFLSCEEWEPLELLEHARMARMPALGRCGSPTTTTTGIPYAHPPALRFSALLNGGVPEIELASV